MLTNGVCNESRRGSGKTGEGRGRSFERGVATVASEPGRSRRLILQVNGAVSS